ncbi:hypothetical protein M0802_010734 [Mischocyttarus mexicanus]|nr:hypothetical protein M0802_010734 [Mischocyttarus mexicanus]
MSKLNESKKTYYKEDNDFSDRIEKRFQDLLKDGSKAPVNTDSLDCELPSFYDPDKFYLGQKAFYNNVFTMMIAKMAGLLALLAVPTVLDVIKFTKQSSVPCTAYRRYVATIFHMLVWYKKEPNVQKEFLESIKIVRKKHCISFRRSFESGLRKASQADMAYAQFGFIGYILLCTEELGVHVTHEEMDGLVHLWRVIGSILGMEDKYNLCMETVEETRALCSRVLNEVFLPSMIDFKKNFNEMGYILVEGLWPVNPNLNPQAFLAFTLHLSSWAAINNNHHIKIDYDDMPLYSKSIYNLQLFVHKYLLQTKYWWSVIFRTFFNQLMIFSIFLTKYFPFLGYWIYGIKQSHVDIFRYKVYN